MTTSVAPLPSVPQAKCARIEIVVGVDNVGAYRPVVELLARLRFPEAHLVLIHSASERLPFAPAFGVVDGIEARFAEATAAAGRTALEEAGAYVASKALPGETLLTHGSPAKRLVAEAQARGADLIAVNAMRTEHIGVNSIGSVSSALVMASAASVLVAKGERAMGENFRAVFATDHSPFAARCLDRFLELAPKGIAEILVVSAWWIDDHEAELLGKDLAIPNGDVDRWIERSVEENNAKVCERLEVAGYRARSLASKGQANDVIDKAMADVAADLLIVGSQGSGAQALALVGSVSLYHTVTGTHPVFVVRPIDA